jgi:hypothetical protein
VDIETASAIEKVTERIDALETSLRGDIADLREEMVGQGAQLREEITGLRGEIAEVRRHAVVLNESTRDDIRLVAEAVAVLTVKVDALRK